MNNTLNLLKNKRTRIPLTSGDWPLEAEAEEVRQLHFKLQQEYLIKLSNTVITVKLKRVRSS